MRRAVALSGLFLIVVGSASLSFGIWYAWTHGTSADIPVWNFLSPEFGTDLVSLLSLSAPIIVLGLVFVFWAYRLKSEKSS